ncbi:MAG: hypothetical protein K6E40_17980, partial [Desulfovibrio sp.]|nr:hypothetical protein [Desulfovibrio sp.]
AWAAENAAEENAATETQNRMEERVSTGAQEAASATVEKETEQGQTEESRQFCLQEVEMLALQSEMDKLSGRMLLLANLIRKRNGFQTVSAEQLEQWQDLAENPNTALPGSLNSIQDARLRSRMYALVQSFGLVLEATAKH